MWYGEAKRIYIQPFGRLPEPLLEEVRQAVETRYGKETLALPDAPVPMHAYNRHRQQINSTRVLEELARSASDGMVLGVIDADMYTEGVNFLFGEADPVDGVAVISTARLREEFYGKASDWRLFIERARKEAVHEAGHLYGLAHCPDPSCVMSFSNTIAEVDRKSEGLCPESAQKLQSATR